MFNSEILKIGNGKQFFRIPKVQNANGKLKVATQSDVPMQATRTF
jgi:hypothetical protein